MTGQKPFWQSKTVWVGIIAILYAAYAQGVTSFGWPPIPDFVVGILGALGITFRATATKAIGGGSGN